MTTTKPPITAKQRLAEANARLTAATKPPAPAKLNAEQAAAPKLEPHIYYHGERQAAEAAAGALMNTGLYGGRPGVRQLLPMLLEIQGMADNFAANWEAVYSARYGAAVTAEFAKASDAIRTLIDLSREA